MGGVPLTALSIVCYPQKGDWDVLGEILAGGQPGMNAEGVVVLGGHSVDDQEIKFGYSVTGISSPRSCHHKFRLEARRCLDIDETHRHRCD
jgi:selenide,water dikinase